MQLNWTIFDWIFVIEYVVVTAVRIPPTRALRANKPIRQQLDPLERALMMLTFVGFMIVPLIYLFSNWLEVADYARPAWVGWLGVAAAAACIWLFHRSHVDLGRQWSPTLEIFEGHAVVTHGVYRLVRHPMYAAIWLWAASQALLLSNWIAGLAGLVSFAAMYFLRVPREERLLLAHFGDAYAHYMAGTGRIFPKLGRRSLPPQ